MIRCVIVNVSGSTVNLNYYFRFKGCIVQTGHLKSYSGIHREYAYNRDIDKQTIVRVRLLSYAYEKEPYLRMKVNFVEVYLYITDIPVHIKIPK